MAASRFIQFARPFIEAARSVFETMAFTQIETLKPEIKGEQRSKGDISAVVGIAGELERDGEKVAYLGMLVISWPYKTYCQLASAMLHEEHAEFNNEIADVGGEICNMVLGNAKRELAAMGYSTNMAIPSMVEGREHIIKYPANTTVIQIPINSAHGKMFMEVCYSEAHEQT